MLFSKWEPLGLELAKSIIILFWVWTEFLGKLIYFLVTMVIIKEDFIFYWGPVSGKLSSILISLYLLLNKAILNNLRNWLKVATLQTFSPNETVWSFLIIFNGTLVLLSKSYIFPSKYSIKEISISNFVKSYWYFSSSTPIPAIKNKPGFFLFPIDVSILELSYMKINVLKAHNRESFDQHHFW